MKLYFSYKTRSVRPRWILEELGANYELVLIDLQNKQQKSPEYLKINPNGHVPTLVDEDLVIYETTAITLYIADKFIERGLAPAFGSKDRGRYYQLMVYASSLERHIKRYAMLRSFQIVDEELVRRKSESLDEIRTITAEISRILDQNEYLLGNEFSAVDITFYHWLWELDNVFGLLKDPVVLRYIEKISKRPARERAIS
jgi:glutathione S-transferase